MDWRKNKTKQKKFYEAQMSDTLAGVDRKQVWVWGGRMQFYQLNELENRAELMVKMYVWSACVGD